jgi:hypothetical protein
MTLSREDRIRLIGPLAFHSFVIGAISKDEHFSVPFVYPLSLGLRYSQTPARKIRIDSRVGEVPSLRNFAQRLRYLTASG